MLSATGPAIPGAAAAGRPASGVSALLSRPAVFGSLIPIVTVLNAAVGMLLPQMMQPTVFGEYALVVSLFNYALIFDIGVSQLTDRWIPAAIAAGNEQRARDVGDMLLWMRLGIGVAAFVLAGSVLAVMAAWRLLPFSLGAGLLATFAGLADMVALGPVCIYRARSGRRNYAIMITTLLTGLIVARVGGLVAGGIPGCFAALAVWYVGCAVLFHRRMPLVRAARPTASRALSLAASGLPFFATSFIWAFYVTGNRWVASFLLDREHFGQFAFSANIFSLLVGAVGGFSAFYYPRIAGRIANSASFAQSGRLMHDLSRLVAGVAGVMAVGILLSGFLVRHIYPHYLPSIATARIVLVAVPPMVLASWLMPVSQSASARPWIDGVVIFPAAAILLGVAGVGLAHGFGAQGIAWASTVSAVPLVGVQLVALAQARIIRPRHGLLVFSLTAVACAALGLLAWGIAA